MTAGFCDPHLTRSSSFLCVAAFDSTLPGKSSLVYVEAVPWRRSFPGVAPVHSVPSKVITPFTIV
jgi:hypothetical protein